jgi:hypothetical protein
VLLEPGDHHGVGRERHLRPRSHAPHRPPE